MVFLQTFFARLRRLVLGQTTSGIDAKCGDHFLHTDFSLLILTTEVIWTVAQQIARMNHSTPQTE